MIFLNLLKKILNSKIVFCLITISVLWPIPLWIEAQIVPESQFPPTWHFFLFLYPTMTIIILSTMEGP